MSLKITVTGAPNTGKTTAARLIQLALEEAGYTDVHVNDLPPVPHGKGDFQERWAKNKGERVDIVVELAAPPRRTDGGTKCEVCGCYASGSHACLGRKPVR